jgi:hypothetical protein
MRNTFLLGFAGLCLAIALVLAWVLGITLFFPHSYLAGLIADRRSFVRAHIDFLMMAQFLFIFALLFRQYLIKPPIWVIASACYGAFFNPLGFLKVALTPKPPADAPSIPYEAHFPIPAAISFALTTIGFLAATALIIRAAWRSRSRVDFKSQDAEPSRAAAE